MCCVKHRAAWLRLRRAHAKSTRPKTGLLGFMFEIVATVAEDLLGRLDPAPVFSQVESSARVPVSPNHPPRPVAARFICV